MNYGKENRCIINAVFGIGGGQICMLIDKVTLLILK